MSEWRIGDSNPCHPETASEMSAMRNFVCHVDFCNPGRRPDTAEVVVEAPDAITAAGVAVQAAIARGYGSRPGSPAGPVTASSVIQRVAPVTRAYLREVGCEESASDYSWSGRFACAAA